ncbi:MAG: transcriptional regulator [Ectothiorhodospiraceae bacterium]|nr:transcriptional regulator [Ectothiorhodospiraceae bacterium]
MQQKKVNRILEDVLGCKWSLEILAKIRQGTNRPGAIERSVEGLSTKVMNERLTKLQRYGILEKYSYPEVPPRVEYAMTEFGGKLAKIIDDIDALQGEMKEGAGA